MSFLDGLIRAGLAGYTGYQSGQAAGEALRLKRQQEEADRQREAQTAALRDALIQQQTEEAKARAFRLLNPEPQAPRNIDPLTNAGIAASVKRADLLARVAARYRRPLVGSGGTPTRTDQNDEAIGQAILNTPMSRPLAQAMGDAFKRIRAGGSTLPPGRLVKQVYEGLKRTRPDLFPKATTGSGGGDFGNLPDGASGAPVPGLPPPVSTADELPLEPGMIQQARTLVQGSDDPTSDLAQSGFTPSQIKAILGQ